MPHPTTCCVLHLYVASFHLSERERIHAPLLERGWNIAVVEASNSQDYANRWTHNREIARGSVLVPHPVPTRPRWIAHSRLHRTPSVMVRATDLHAATRFTA